MSMPPPEPHPTTQAGRRYPQPTYDSLEEITKQIASEVAKDLPPTSFRDESDLPETGDAPPYQQPGRPAMSQRAVDASVLLIAGGWFTLCLGAAASAVLYFSGKANPMVVGFLVAALPATFFTLGGLVKKARHLPPREVHNHGPVYQTNNEDHSTSKHYSLTTKSDTTINPTPAPTPRRNRRR